MFRKSRRESLERVRPRIMGLGVHKVSQPTVMPGPVPTVSNGGPGCLRCSHKEGTLSTVIGAWIGQIECHGYRLCEIQA